MDTQLLEKIGLTRGEARVYLALLKLGASSTGPVAKASGISRSKVYAVMDKLAEKGLASHVDRRGVTYYHAVEPSKIKDYLQEREEELKGLEAEFEEFLPKLLSYAQEKPAGHEINIYQGFKGHRIAHEQSYHKLKRGDEYYVLGVPHVPLWEHVRYWRTDHERREAAGIGCRMLFNRDAPRKLLMNRNSYRLCEARYMPIDVAMPCYFTMFADTTLITLPAKEPITIEVVSKGTTESFMAYFRGFWELSKPFR